MREGERYRSVREGGGRGGEVVGGVNCYFWISDERGFNVDRK